MALMSPLTTASRCHCPTKGHFLFQNTSQDEAEQASKGTAVVVSLVHAFFHLHGLGERLVTLQADNCVGQNKKTTMMWYLPWQCGQDFTCVPQLCQDWHYCTFEFDQDHPAVMRMKTMPSDTNLTEYQKMANQDLQLPFLTYLLLRVMSLQMTLTGKCKTKAIAVFLAGGNADPVAIETSGGFGPKTTEFLKELGHRLKQFNLLNAALLTGYCLSIVALRTLGLAGFPDNTSLRDSQLPSNVAMQLLCWEQMGSEEEEFLV
eukprot:Em0025g72a